MSDPSAEVLTIGTELLLGEILDTNAQEIALALRQIGLNIFRTTTVGDNRERIAGAVRDACNRAQVVIIAGGLGPTVDDTTREGIALAFDLRTEFYPELWEQIKTRFTLFGRTPTENNRRQALLPIGARPIENPVGTAPGFLLEVEECIVIAVPGVPAEMRFLLDKEVIPYLCERLDLDTVIRTRILRTAGQGESWLDEKIMDLEESDNPTLGLSAHPGRVDLRITAKALDDIQATEMTEEMEAKIRERLGDFIYGVDRDTLEGCTLDLLQARNWKLATAEIGTNALLSGSLSALGEPFVGGWILSSLSSVTELELKLDMAMRNFSADAGLAVAIQKSDDKLLLWLHLRNPLGHQTRQRSFGGAPQNAPAWAESLALDYLRRYLLENP